MPTTFTSRLGLALPTTGELDGTWGNELNNSTFRLVDEAVAGLAVINTWVANSHTLTTANGATSEARQAILRLTDTGVTLTGPGELITPDATKIYIIVNQTAQPITVKTASGTGVSVGAGTDTIVISDGTNIVEIVKLQVAAGVEFTPAGDLSADNVQAALEELDSEKLGGNQSITLSGDVSGTGTTAITVTVADDSHNHVAANITDQNNIDAGSVDGYDIVVDADNPSGTDPNTIYFVV